MAFFPPGYDQTSLPNIYLADSNIKWVNLKYYLGSLIENNGSNLADMQRLISYIYARGNCIFRRFNHCNEHVKKELFRAYFASLYGAALWRSYTDRSISKVKVAFNNVIRALFNLKLGDSISTFLMNSNMIAFKPLLRKCVFSLYNRLHSSENFLISTLLQSSFYVYNSRLFKV